MKLTPNFSKSEFDSKDGATMPDEVLNNVKKLAASLQALRDYIALDNGPRSIKINSGYRSPKHNSAVGGAENSQHLTGKAADIVVSGMTPQEVAHKIDELILVGRMKQGGLKAYDKKGFTHYDIRGTKARW